MKRRRKRVHSSPPEKSKAHHRAGRAAAVLPAGDTPGDWSGADHDAKSEAGGGAAQESRECHASDGSATGSEGHHVPSSSASEAAVQHDELEPRGQLRLAAMAYYQAAPPRLPSARQATSQVRGSPLLSETSGRMSEQPEGNAQASAPQRTPSRPGGVTPSSVAHSSHRLSQASGAGGEPAPNPDARAAGGSAVRSSRGSQRQADGPGTPRSGTVQVRPATRSDR